MANQEIRLVFRRSSGDEERWDLRPGLLLWRWAAAVAAGGVATAAGDVQGGKGTRALLQLGGLDLEEIPWLRHGTRLGGEAAELGGVLLIGRWKGCRWGGCAEERKEKMIGWN